MARGIMAFGMFHKRDLITFVRYGCVFCDWSTQLTRRQNALRREAKGRAEVRAHTLAAHPDKMQGESDV
jgi:hypothetical protein